MLARITLPVSLLLLISMFGIYDAQAGWGVTYTPNFICALKGSTVIMECTYTYPSSHTVQTAFWTKELLGVEPPDLASDTEYRGRVQYGDNNDCTLKLSNVTEKDQRRYYFRFKTNQRGGKYQGRDGVELHVTGLQVEVPETVIEGTKVTLRCKTTCRLTDNPTFTWYRNQQQLQTTNLYSHTYYHDLYLQPVRMEDEGRYQCAVGNHNSSAVTLNVGYPPKNVSVSISPSDEIMEGSSVTLTCSSDAKPAASYYWYKGTKYKASGQMFTIHKIRSNESGNYKCLAWNEHGDQESSIVNIDVHYLQKSVLVSVKPSGEIIEGSLVNLTCSAVSHPPVENYTWFKERTYKGCGETLTVRNISSEDGGEYKCKCIYNKQAKYSGPVAVKVLYAPKRVSVSFSSSAEPDQSGLVNLTCSADADPPVVNYTWYKEGGSLAVGSGQSYGAWPGESYYCRAQNKLGEQTASEALFVTPVGGFFTTDYIAVGVGVGLCLLAAGLVVFFCRRRKMQMSQKDKHDHKNADADANVDADAKTEAYAALDPSSRSSNDEYSTRNNDEKPELMVDVDT